jgi:transposase
MYIGVDTHKQTHTLVVIDEQGRWVGTKTVANTPEGWMVGQVWVREQAGRHTWGLENSGSLGKGFAQFLLSQGETAVCEVVRGGRRSIGGVGAPRLKPTRPMHWLLPGCSWPKARVCQQCDPTIWAPNCA